MGEVKKITKKQFDKAYNTYSANGWIKFAFKYFSKETEKNNMNLRNYLGFILFGMFLLGFFGTIFKVALAFIGTITITYTILLVVLVLYLLSAVLMNNFRIKKIAKLLGVSKVQYNSLQRKFYS